MGVVSIEKTVGGVIRELRDFRGITQLELARRVEISNTYLSDIENDRTEPSLKIIRKIARGLNVDWRDIFLLTKYVNNGQKRKY